ncbi:hypothetical protein [Pseudomonas protegens]
MDSESNDDDKTTSGQPITEATENLENSEVEVPGALLEIREFREPQLTAVFDIGADYVAPVLGPITEIEVHAYDQFSNYYGSMTKRAYEGSFIYDPITFESVSWRRKGPNALHYRYKQFFGWSKWYDTGWFYLMDRPVIHRPTTVYTSSLVTIRGIAEPSSNVLLFKGGEVLGETSALASGGFSIDSIKLIQSNYSIAAVCYVQDYRFGVYSDTYDFSVILPPVIAGVSPPLSRRPVIVGHTGLPGATIDVRIRDTDTYLFKDVLVDDNGSWSAQSTYTLPSAGRYPLVAYQRLRGSVTEAGPDFSYLYHHTPNILGPEPLQGQSFILQGSNGLEQAQLKVYPDLEDSPVYGTGTVTQANGSWTVQVSGIPPGPASLVVEQYEPGPLGRSVPRLFKIRPPVLGQPTVVFPDDTTVKFSGTGHYNPSLATQIQFLILKYPGATPPDTPANVTVKADGSWEITAAGWSMGTYELRVIQKIADNASGWIESLPFDFKAYNWMPDIIEVDYTPDYRPVFSGAGYTGANVRLTDRDTNQIAPNAPVNNGQWSSQALQSWGPTNKREVRVSQFLGENQSQNPFVLFVSIPPLAPDLDAPPEDGLEPTFSGTCWSAAVVTLKFSDDATEYEAQLTGDRWTFKRNKPFEADVRHTVTVTQTVVELTSLPTSTTFVVHRVLLQPLITEPAFDAEVGYDLTIYGDNAMQGAIMQLHDAQFGRPLGNPAKVSEGKWLIELHALELRPYTLQAQQTLNGRQSPLSAEHKLKVVVPPPRFTAPVPNGKLPRTAKITGTGMPSALVDIWREGDSQAFLKAVPVSAMGQWEVEVTLAIGFMVIWATQTFISNGTPMQSRPNDRLRYQVVPAAPVIETPTGDDHVGRRVVVSGFATPDDTVEVTLADAEASAVVQEDRTWSVTLEPGQVEGFCLLKAVAARDGFESVNTQHSVRLATFLPSIDIPAPGRWVGNPVFFAGKGRDGVGELVDAFNPDNKWIPLVTVSDKRGWQGESAQSLAPGSRWCYFRLQPAGSDPVGSDWVVSKRFEVEDAQSENLSGDFR